MTTPEREDLERLLAEDAPRPSPEFAARMDERLARGFPRRRRLPGLLRVPRLPRPAVAGLASAGLAVAVAAGLLAGEPGGEDEDLAVAPDRPAPLAREAAEPGLADGGADEPAGARALPVPPEGQLAPGQAERHIERSAQLTLAAPAHDVAEAAERVVAVAERHRGFVLRSELRTGEEGGGGTFELRIPHGRLRAALSDLAAIGEVRSRSEQGQDVTATVSRAEERLEEARAERRSLLRRLERADGDRQARAIRRRLRLVSAEIRRLDRELRALRERVDYAAVAVTLEEADGADGGAGGGSDGAGAALDDALGSLEGALGLAIRALGVLLPLGLVGGAAWLGARLVLRRRRDAALG